MAQKRICTSYGVGSRRGIVVEVSGNDALVGNKPSCLTSSRAPICGHKLTQTFGRMDPSRSPPDRVHVRPPILSDSTVAIRQVTMTIREDARINLQKHVSAPVGRGLRPPSGATPIALLESLGEDVLMPFPLLTDAEAQQAVAEAANVRYLDKGGQKVVFAKILSKMT